MPRSTSPSDTLGSRLRVRMAETGISNARLAQIVGVDPATVSQWRSDKFPPSDDRLAAIAKALSADPAWLRYGGDAHNGRAPKAGEQGTAEHERTRDLPRQLRLMALDFEREALKAGADEPFMRYVRNSFADPDFVALFAGGPDETPMTAEEALDDMRAHIAELRSILKTRLKRAREKSGQLAPKELDE